MPKTIEIVRVDWNDPRAVDLRAAMDRDVGPRYAGRHDEALLETLGRVFTVDPSTIAATFITVVDGAPVAHAALRRLGDEWELKRLVTLPEHRGHGYSRALIVQVEEEVVALGGRRLILQTGDRQPEAVALYRRLGYHPIPVFAPYTVVPESLCFARELVSPTDPALWFRLARQDELPAVGQLTRDAYLHDYIDLPDEYQEELGRPERLQPEYDVWVAVQGAQLVGTVAVLKEGLREDSVRGPDETYFRLLAIAPGARRRGLGRALTDLVIDLARARDSARVVMNSGPQMLGAHALYFGLGFERRADREHLIVINGEEWQLLTFVLELGGTAAAA